MTTNTLRETAMAAATIMDEAMGCVSSQSLSELLSEKAEALRAALAAPEQAAEPASEHPGLSLRASDSMMHSGGDLYAGNRSGAVHVSAAPAATPPSAAKAEGANAKALEDLAYIEQVTRHMSSIMPIKFERIRAALTAAAEKPQQAAQAEQARPLTDEQIIAALKACEPPDYTQEGWIWKTRIKWARAIERAHGIGTEGGNHA